MYSKLARIAAEHFIRHLEIISLPPLVYGELQQQKACYVTILENPGRRVRARYGQPLPQQSCLGEEIIANSVQAIVNSRTSAIRRVDLTYLAYSVLVLDPLERISGPEHLDPEVFGLYVRSDRNKTAVLLPHRVGIETAADQIATAIRESHIDPRQEAITLYRFHVSYHE